MFSVVSCNLIPVRYNLSTSMRTCKIESSFVEPHTKLLPKVQYWELKGNNPCVLEKMMKTATFKLRRGIDGYVPFS